MPAPFRFRVRPVYHGTDLLIEVMGDHRAKGFPDIKGILRDALRASQIPHPEKLDDSRFALLQDRFISFWVYAGGAFEIDDDTWGLFVSASENNEAVIADIQRALASSSRFVQEFVDAGQFR